MLVPSANGLSAERMRTKAVLPMVEKVGGSACSDRDDWLIDRAKQQATNNYSDYGIVTRILDSKTGEIAIVAAGVGRGGTIAAGEFLIDPAHLALVVDAPRIPRQKEYGVRAKQRDHRQPSWHTEDGSRPLLIVFPGIRPGPLSAARTAGQVQSFLQP